MGISPLNEFSLFSLLADANDGMYENLPESSSDSFTALESNALAHLPVALAKSYLYVRNEAPMKASDLSHFLNKRVDFLEVTLVSFASLAHNFVMALLYSGFFLLTFAQSRHVIYSVQKHWLHIRYSGLCMLIGFAGALHPKWGIDSIQKLVKNIWEEIKRDYRRDLRYFEPRLVKEIKDKYANNENQIYESVLVYALNNKDLYQYGIIFPFLKEFGVNLKKNSVKTLDEVFSLAQKTYAKCVNAVPSKEGKSESPNADFSLAPLLSECNETLKNLMPVSSERASIILESSAILELTSAVVRTALYIGKASDLRINDPSHFLSSRFVYLETAILSVVTTVHHLFMTFLYGGLMFATMGLSQEINYEFRKHWHHTLYSLLASGIGLAGTIVPTLGAYLALTFFTLLWNRVKKDFENDSSLYERPFIKEFKRIYFENKEQISKAIRYYINNEIHSNKIHLFLARFEERLPGVEKTDKLIEIIKETIGNYSELLGSPEYPGSVKKSNTSRQLR